MSRENLIGALHNLANAIANQEENDESVRRAYEYLFGDDRLANRLGRLEEKLDHLLAVRREGRCAFTDNEVGHTLQMIVAAQARPQGLAYLSNCIEGSKTLTICDPFLRSSLGRNQNASDYVAAFSSVLPQSLKVLEVFSANGRRDAVVADGLNRMLKQRQIRVTCYKTNTIHDRVWIRDYNEAFAVGTSFNGIGNKCSFILPLPVEDFRLFVRELSVLRDDIPKSRSL